MDFPIYTSYFYQIRNFTPNLIPISMAMNDPEWYKPKDGKEYYIDKRGVVCGLRYEPLIVQRHGSHECPGPKQCGYAISGISCPVGQEYSQLLNTLVNKEKTLKAFRYCLNKFNANAIVLMVYEAPSNPCSERYALQEFFDCKELKIDRKEK